MKKKMFILFLLIGAISMITMSFHYITNDNTGILKGKAIAESYCYLFILRAHIIGGLIAISIGPFQFSKGLRRKYPYLHKRVGYTYFLAVIISGLAGLIVAQFAMGGWVSSLGFTILSILWLWTSIRAIRAILLGNIDRHRQFMFFSYSLTFAAIPQRTMLLTALFLDIAFLDIYRFSAWMPWIINLLIAQYIYASTMAKAPLINKTEFMDDKGS